MVKYYQLARYMHCLTTYFFINHYFWIPIKQPGFQWKVKGKPLGFLIVAKTSVRTLAKWRQGAHTYRSSGLRHLGSREIAGGAGVVVVK